MPGYSEHNRDWAVQISQQMNLKHVVVVHEWRHWTENNTSLSLSYELKKIIEEIGDEKINIIAKSVGVFVALNLIPKISKQINKVILCGIASVANQDRKDLVKMMLSNVPVKSLLCIQNEKDKYVPFAEAASFYHSVNPEIEIISKPRTDHDYPYPDDFSDFLTQ